MKRALPVLNVLRLGHLPILRQLRLEEALYRCDNQNWCILSQPENPAIILGIGGKPKQLVDVQNCKKDGIDLVKRFTGGGTVYIDRKTSIISFIINKEAAPSTTSPPSVMQWAANIYDPVFASEDKSNPQFLLREHDFCLLTTDGICRKFGGNAQALGRERWVHHTSFLWEFDESLLQRYLLLPERRPAYRANRSHLDFLVKLNSFPNLFLGEQPPRRIFESRLLQSLSQSFQLRSATLSEAFPYLSKDHTRSTTLVDVEGNKLPDPESQIDATEPQPIDKLATGNVRFVKSPNTCRSWV